MDTATHPRLEEFLDAYIDCALWITIDESSGQPLDDGYRRSDFDARTIDKMRSDCNEFLNELGVAISPDFSFDDTYDAGRDFWLNRNGHGSGFWDGDYKFNGRDISRKLSDLAETYGGFDLYVGDDGKVYGS